MIYQKKKAYGNNITAELEFMKQLSTIAHADIHM